MIARARALVTGGAGFIGSHLVDVLLARGDDVVVFDNLSSGSWATLAHHKDNSRLTLIKGDIMDKVALAEAMVGVRFVFHLATQNVRMSLRRPTIVHDVNTTGTLNTLKESVVAGVERFLYCSSSEVNGTADIAPLPEDYHFKPETIYGASKLAGEYYSQVFHRAGWLNVVIARPHNNYGPREYHEGIKGEVIPRFILWALAGKQLMIFGDGRQTRDFTYVTETASFLARLLECDAALGQTFNICRGEEVSINDIACHVAKLTGLNRSPAHMPSRPNDVLRLLGDATRLRKTLGDSPRIGIEQGLRQTVDWFRENVPVTDEVIASMEPSNWAIKPPEHWLEAVIKRSQS